MLRNKTAIECWNIQKYKIYQFVPLKKQGKQSRKKHLSKEAIRKIVYNHTISGTPIKDEDYTNYKEAYNAAKTKIRQSKRSDEQKLACNIKNYSKSFMHISGVNNTYEIRMDH